MCMKFLNPWKKWEHTLSQFNSLIATLEWQEHTTIFLTTFNQDVECARCIKFQCGWTLKKFPLFYSFHFVCCIFIFCFSILSLFLSCALCMYLHLFWRSKIVGAYFTAGHRLQSLFFQIIDPLVHIHPIISNLFLITFCDFPILTQPIQPTIIVKSPTLDVYFNSFHVVVGRIVTYDNSSNIVNGVKQESSSDNLVVQEHY
jgi:hypothetical protein